jgi:membrane protease YdiL (CAAX protease family)
MPAAASPLRQFIRRYPLLSFFALACLISWTLWLPLYYPPLAGWRLYYHHALGSFGPLLAGLLVSDWQQGRAGLGRLLDGMTRWHLHWFWYALVLLGPFVLAVVAMGVAASLSRQPLQLSGLGRTAEMPELGVISFLIYNILTFGFGEETGWRGFALPRLEQRYGARASVLLLTLGWAVWHLPLFLYRPGYVHMDAAGVVGWLLSLLTGAVLLSWLYHGTRGSVLICALFHATIDVAFTSQGVSPLATNVLGMLITVLGILAFFYLPTGAAAHSLRPHTY